MDKVECPVCSKEVLSLIIEEHVGRCLFLSEPTEPSKDFHGQKRPASKIGCPSSLTSSGRQKSPVLKKLKSDLSKCESLKNTISSPTSSGEKTSRTNFGLKLNSVNDEIQKPSLGNKDHVPLAEKMRPTSLTTYVGQEHVIGPQTVLFQLLNKSEVPNIILWGPPGCGKTSLAHVIAHICKQNSSGKLRYVKLSAAMSGVSDVKEAVSVAGNELKFGRRTVMFMDEIHRFNKLQQDIFLPHIEAGTVTLIGATTENPSFNLNSALLSRCRVIVLEKLSVPSLISILKTAVKSLEGIVHTTNRKYSRNGSSDDSNSKFLIDEATIEWLAETCDGDARIALGGLELAVLSKAPNKTETSLGDRSSITLEDVKESLKKTHMLYDRKGDQHYDIISALHKSVRASDENASMYWLARMMAGGEDPVYIARRLVRMASEDIGLEDPEALSIAVNTMQACKMIGMPECDVLLAQCVTYMARAPKSRMMEDSLRAAQRLIADHKGPQPSVPLHLRNAPTKLMGNLGYGKGYNMMHKDVSGLNYLPEGLENVNFFQ